MAKEIKHYGVLGMKWGHRRANGGSTVTVGKGLGGKAREVGGLVKDAIKDDISKVSSARSSAIGLRKGLTKAAGELGAFGVKTTFNNLKSATSGIMKVRAKGIEARKATVQKLKSFASKLGNNMKEHFNRFQVQDSTFTAAALRAQAKQLKTSANPKDHKNAAALEKEAQWIEDDLNETFTPEEIKKYLNG